MSNDNYEKDIKDLIQQMHQQQGGYAMPPQTAPVGEGAPMSGPPVSQVQPGTQFESPDQSPHLMNENINATSPDQSPVNPINSVRPMGTPINHNPPKPAGMNTSSDGCPQCGLSHPPVPAGQTCPLAPITMKGSDGQSKVVDVNKFLANLKNIIVSQSEAKGIQDIEKLFKNIIVEVTKYIEGYSE